MRRGNPTAIPTATTPLAASGAAASGGGALGSPVDSLSPLMPPALDVLFSPESPEVRPFTVSVTYLQGLGVSFNMPRVFRTLFQVAPCG